MLNNNFLFQTPMPQTSQMSLRQNQSNMQRITCPLNLRQIDTWDSPKELYINGIKWTLRKDYRDSSGSIPNIMNIQFDDVNSGFMKVDELGENIYLFLYYGTILPKMGSYEKPMSVFFQWFNDKPVQLRKDLISEADWNRANVYVSDYGSLQLATKNALFGALNEKQNIENTEILPDIKLNVSNVNHEIQSDIQLGDTNGRD